MRTARAARSQPVGQHDQTAETQLKKFIAGDQAPSYVTAKGAVKEVVLLDVDGTLPALDGSDLTNLNASNLASGTVPLARLTDFVGDSGAGGTRGIVPAPAIGDATKFLKGDGSWADVPGDISAVNTTLPLTGGGSSGAITLDINNFGGDAGAGGTKGTVPAPAAGDATKFLKGDGTWSPAPGAGSATFDNVGSGTNTTAAMLVGTGSTLKATGAGEIEATSCTGNSATATSATTAGNVTGTVAVANGGTGATTLTAYAVLCGGAVATNPVQPVASVGTAGQVLTSNGAGALPTFQAPATAVAIVTKSANYTAATTDRVILCNAAGGAFTIALPAAAGATGALFYIKKIDATGNAVTIDGDGAETIDGATTQAINTPNTAITVACNGSAWYIL